MSMPSPAESVLVEPGEVAALAADLSALATELRADADTCEAVAHTFAAALGAEDGWRPRATATAWAELHRLLAGLTAALATALTAAVTATLSHDAALAAGIGAQRPDDGTGLR